MNSISVIIPTLNEAENLNRLIPHVRACLPPEGEIIVADGASTDKTLEVARLQRADRVFVTQKRGRACQMNEAAALAKGEVLYFVHADTLPPATFAEDIFASLRAGYAAGSYRSQFEGAPALMRVNAWFTRFNLLFCRGGDQSIFVTRDLFFSVGGYREDFQIMEDFDFLAKVRKKARFKVIPKSILISARKFEGNSYVRVNLANIAVVMMYRMGASQQAMTQAYRKWLNYP